MKQAFQTQGKKQRGIALIIVLASVVLLTILVLAFLTGVGTELQSSKMYANGSSVKLLAQSAVSLVMGEIQAGTLGQVNSGSGVQTLCWASQPGMIRNYDSSGNPYSYYKLYSDDAMYGTGAFDHVANTVPTTWYNQKGIYVDLNQPVYVNNASFYPILDGNPSDYSSSQYTSPLASIGVTPSSSVIKTLKPMTSGLPAVTGFWLNNNTPLDQSASPAPNAAPMPVKWLYVLKNGEVIVPDTSSNPNAASTQVTFNNGKVGGVSQPAPSKNDPIVGRMAFWTDDETCKVNVNTASDGANVGAYGFTIPSSGTGAITMGTVNAGTKSTFWDTPRTYTPQDFAYAYSQPVQNEFQRYPGHPATVALSAVFNSFTSDANFPENIYSTKGSGATSDIPSLAPRISSGGSKEGTLSTVVSTPIGSSTLKQLGFRLYSTADDFLFQPSLASGTPGTGLRSLNSVPVPELTPALLQQAKFFITANSVAPDVNVFNLPRVSMWPITLNLTAGTQQLTPYDQLLSFCSTISNGIYYFQRQDPTSQTVDLPSTLASGTVTGLPRNRQLLEYLRTLTGQNFPGFGGNFASKYNATSPGDRDQILTEIFDYIRSTNLQDSSTGATAYAKSFDTNAAATNPYQGAGTGQVVPIVDTNFLITDSVGSPSATNNPRGFGRFPTIQQAALIFIGAGDHSTDPSPDQPAKAGPPATSALYNPNPPSSYTPIKVAANSQRVQAGFFLQMFDPSQGVSITRPRYIVKVSNLDSLQWTNAGNTTSIFPVLPANSFPYIYSTSGIYIQPTTVGINYQNLYGLIGGNGYSGFSYGGMIDYRQQNLLRGSITGGSATAIGHFGLPIYPYISPPTGQTSPVVTALDLPSGGSFTLSQGVKDIAVQIYTLDSTWSATSGLPTPTLVQTVNLRFPTISQCPVPYSINNNQVCVAPYNTPTYTTPTYSNIPANTPAPTTPYSAATYLPAGTASPALYDFLSFFDSYPSSSHTWGSGMGRLDWGAENPLVTTCDVVRGIVATPGDMRLVAARQTVPSKFYAPITGSTFPNATDYYGTGFFSHMLRFAFGCPVYGGIGGRLVVPSSSAIKYSDYLAQYLQRGGTNFGDSTYGNRSFINPADTDVPNQFATISGDWDTGFANARDGAYINKADEGDAGNPAIALSTPSDQNTAPYFELNYGNATVGSTFFSPNRMIPSPGMLGSLPTGVWANQPWQTLLFRPGPAGHKGLGISKTGGDVGAPYTTPPDHLLLDLFNMPVVEPYAISTPLATSGRINMNYLIVPFTYINRDTGLRAVLKNQMITAIATTAEGTYKTSQNASGTAPPTTNPTTRLPINLDSTLSQFLNRFYNISGGQGATGTKDIFHSSSEICDIDLVPIDAVSPAPSIPITRSKMDSYWTVNGLTGDNVRERPYTNIYPLLTTKSNSYTVHYRVQTLKQVPGGDPTMWREGTDVVNSEYRGSQTIERYVDPNDTTKPIPDYASIVANSGTLPPASQNISQFYKFRIVSTKQFPP